MPTRPPPFWCSLVAAAVLVAACGCDLERPYDPLNEYEPHVWTAATAGLQQLPRPGLDDDKPWPYEESGIWPLYQERQYFDGTYSQSLGFPFWSRVRTPDGLQLEDVFLIYRDAQRDKPGGLTLQRTHFLWPFFQYRRKANESDYTLFPLIYWTTQLFPDAKTHDRPALPNDPGESMLSSALALLDLGGEAAGAAQGEADPARPAPIVASDPALGLPPIYAARPAFSRSSFTRTERPYDGERDHWRSRLWIFPFFFFSEDTRLGRDLAVIPLGGSISNFIGKERVWFFLFPLWASSHEPAYDAQHFLWPLFALWDGPGTPNGPGRAPTLNAAGQVAKYQDRRHGWRFLPFYMQDDWENRQHKYAVLWPLWTSEDIGLDTKYPTRVRSLFPFYASSVSPRHQLYSYLSVFSRMQIFYSDGTWARTVWSAWPVFSYTHGDVQGLRLFPIWDSREDSESYYVTLLWPMFRGEHQVSSRETVDTYQFGLDPLTILGTLKAAVAGSVPLGRTESSRPPGWVRQSWWEVAQPHGDPVRFGRLTEANAFYLAQVVGRRWYEEGRVGKYWGPDAEDFPPTSAALGYLYKDAPPPPIDAERAAAVRARLGVATVPTEPRMTAPAEPVLPRGARGPLAFPLEPRKRTLQDLIAAAETPDFDWQPSPPQEQVKVTAGVWPVYKYQHTQRDDLSVSLFNPLFFPDADGAMENQWGCLWNLFLYQNSAEDIGRERMLLTWWRRDWNGPARHTELVGVFNYWRMTDRPDRSLLTLGGGWLWTSRRAPRKSFHGNMLFAVQNDADRPSDWWLLNGLVGQDHDEEGRREWRMLWMRF